MQYKNHNLNHHQFGGASARTIGRMKFSLIVALLILISMGTSRASDVNDPRSGIVVTARDENGNPVELSYSPDRRLMRARIGTTIIDYSYTDRNLLAYAMTDKGVVYTVSRDHGHRIVQIDGANSTHMNVTYSGEFIVPSKIVVVKVGGPLLTVYDQPKGPVPTGYSIESIDMRLSQIYEAYAFSDCLSAKCL